MNNVIDLFQVRCNKIGKKPTCFMQTLELVRTKSYCYNVDFTNGGAQHVIESIQEAVFDGTSSLSQIYGRFLRLQLKSKERNDLEGELQVVVDKPNDRGGHRAKVRRAFLKE
jgi:hypothetical protein